MINFKNMIVGQRIKNYLKLIFKLNSESGIAKITMLM
jgi:hypothetical protein